MVPNPRFLVVDDNADSRFLLVKTLLRKFPHAMVRESGNAEVALQIVRADRPHAIVAHRAEEIDGLSLVRTVRETAPTTPLIMISGYDRTKEALAAGATLFLPYEEWLRIGVVMQDLFADRPAPSATPPAASTERERG